MSFLERYAEQHLHADDLTSLTDIVQASSGGAQRMTRLIGEGKAIELMLTGDYDLGR